MNILQLRYFTAVAQLENMTRAAALLHITQSSLSKNIVKLEEEVGVPLFERHGKKLKLNPAGARFLEHSEKLLSELSATMDDVHMLAKGISNKIYIGMAGSCAPLLQCISSFTAMHPAAEFNITCTIEDMEYVDIGSFDCLIYPAGQKYEKFNGFPFYRERYFIAVKEGDPLCEKAAVSPASLGGRSMIFMRGSDSGPEFPYRMCMALALTFSSISFTDSRMSHAHMIASGMVCGFVPEQDAYIYRALGIRLIPVTDERFTREMLICFKRKKHMSGLAMAFAEYAAETLHLESAEGDNAEAAAPQVAGEELP